MSSAGKFQNIVVDNEQAGVNLVCEMNPKSVRKYVHCQHGHVWRDTESWGVVGEEWAVWNVWLLDLESGEVLFQHIR